MKIESLVFIYSQSFVSVLHRAWDAEVLCILIQSAAEKRTIIKTTMII